MVAVRLSSIPEAQACANARARLDMTGTHKLVFTLKDGNTIVAEWEGDESLRVRDWWVTGDRIVDIAVHTFVPTPVDTGSTA